MIGPLIDGAIKRRKVVLGVTLIAALFGLFAYLNMPRESEPDIDLPYISVIVPYPGVSPEDSERLAANPAWPKDPMPDTPISPPASRPGTTPPCRRRTTNWATPSRPSS